MFRELTETPEIIERACEDCTCAEWKDFLNQTVAFNNDMNMDPDPDALSSTTTVNVTWSACVAPCNYTSFDEAGDECQVLCIDMYFLRR